MREKLHVIPRIQIEISDKGELTLEQLEDVNYLLARAQLNRVHKRTIESICNFFKLIANDEIKKVSIKWNQYGCITKSNILQDCSWVKNLLRNI